MFRKRSRKEIPEWIFIPKTARIASILQLCIAFTCFLWIASQPFMGDLFALKSEMTVFETLFGTRKAQTSIEEEKLKSFQEMYTLMSSEKKAALNRYYEQLQTKSSVSMLSKLKQSLFLFWDASPLVLGLMLFSTAIPIMLLKRVDGAKAICWSLPVLAFTASMDMPKQEHNTVEQMLVPSEKDLLDNFGSGPLSGSILDQHQQLQQAWQKFLIVMWGKETPSSDEVVFAKQTLKGEFAFIHARAIAKIDVKIKLPSEEKAAIPFLHIYAVWLLIFSWIASRYKENNRKFQHKIEV